MATSRTTSSKPKSKNTEKPYIGGLSFNKDNYTWIIIGAVVIIVGMILLSGGQNTDPNIFDTNLVYSPRRITVAPIVILIGFAIEIYAILKKPKNTAATGSEKE